MKRRMLLTVLVLILSSTAGAENWPGWRGPSGMGISSETNLPVEWSKAKNVRWKVELTGAGVSTPVVWKDRVFLTASDGRLNDRLHVFCYHRADGKLLWHSKFFGTAPTDLFAPGGMAVPTPVTDGKHLFTLFGTGDLMCLDFAGKPVWIRSLAQEYGPFRNRWGMGTSPILVGDNLIVQVDHWSQSYLLCVDAKTGANRWKTDRDSSVNWSSPLAVKFKDHEELIVLGTYRAMGYDLGTGSERWHVRGMGMQCIPSPIVEGNRLVAASGENTMAIKLDGKSGNLTDSNVLWINKKAAAYLPSPVLYKGLVYIAGDRGINTCLDAAKGTVVWKKRLGDQYYASPVAGDGKVYFPSKEGIVYVVKAGPQYEVLAKNDMGEGIVASLAISDGQIFLRGEKHLFCIGTPKASQERK
ncbi:MAG TPA: PQQ-binding-like beta-propeller repeat protein [Gemmataceae bacterium]|nr:PQQ-binding-like beta-propeller repeat protein [Gemmataceae bacterium]